MKKFEEYNNKILEEQEFFLNKFKFYLNNLIIAFKEQNTEIKNEINFFVIYNKNKNMFINDKKFNNDLKEIDNLITYLLDNYLKKMLYTHENKIINTIIIDLIYNLFVLYAEKLDQKNKIVIKTSIDLFNMYIAIIYQIVNKKIKLPLKQFIQLIEVKEIFFNKINLPEKQKVNVKIFFYKNLLPEIIYNSEDNYVQELINEIIKNEKNKDKIFELFKKIGKKLDEEIKEIFEKNIINFNDPIKKEIFNNKKIVLKEFIKIFINLTILVEDYYKEKEENKLKNKIKK